MKDTWAKYLFLFVGVVVLFSSIAAIYPTAATSGDNLAPEGMCTSNGCFYNASRTTFDCSTNDTSPDSTIECGASGYVRDGLPLGGLFVGGGVIFIIIAALLLKSVIKKK